MNKLIRNPRILVGLVILGLLLVTFLPWTGGILFNTKGEPREALVAVSMLNSGNLILPESYGADIPYKPPFLAWLIAGASGLFGLGEFASRLPSVIAVIALVLATYIFFLRKTGSLPLAAATAMITFSNVEVWRAATACRVDMLLTVFIVTSIYVLVSSDRPRLSVPAILLMSCGVLTKGPVGMVLPCLVAGIYLLLSGRRFWPTFGLMAANGLLALIIPALWYLLAWQQGGERFVRLALEENFGRFTGTMSYESHVNPWWYNLTTIAAGMLPYTLLALLSLASIKRLKKHDNSEGSLKSRFKALKKPTLLSLTACVVIFIFYCLPASKRSVYLLPMYPFMSYFVALLASRLIASRSRVVSVYAAIMGFICLTAAWGVWGFHIVDASGIGTLKGEAHDLVVSLYNDSFGIVEWALLITAILTASYALVSVARKHLREQAFATIAAIITTYWLVSSIALPRTLNPRSDLSLAAEIERFDPTVSNTYTFNDIKMLRYYTAAFYLGDRLRLFAPESGSSQSDGRAVRLPENGNLVVNTRDMPLWLERYGSRYTLDTLYTSSRRSCDSGAPVMIVSFRHK